MVQRIRLFSISIICWFCCLKEIDLTKLCKTNELTEEWIPTLKKTTGFDSRIYDILPELKAAHETLNATAIIRILGSKISDERVTLISKYWSKGYTPILRGFPDERLRILGVLGSTNDTLCKALRNQFLFKTMDIEFITRLFIQMKVMDPNFVLNLCTGIISVDTLVDNLAEMEEKALGSAYKELFTLSKSTIKPADELAQTMCNGPEKLTDEQKVDLAHFMMRGNIVALDYAIHSKCKRRLHTMGIVDLTGNLAYLVKESQYFFYEPMARVSKWIHDTLDQKDPELNELFTIFFLHSEFDLKSIEEQYNVLPIANGTTLESYIKQKVSNKDAREILLTVLGKTIYEE